MIYLLGVTHAQADPFIINEDASIFAQKTRLFLPPSNLVFLRIVRVNAWLSEFRMVSQCVKQLFGLIIWTIAPMSRYTLNIPILKDDT